MTALSYLNAPSASNYGAEQLSTSLIHRENIQYIFMYVHDNKLSRLRATTNDYVVVIDQFSNVFLDF